MNQRTRTILTILVAVAGIGAGVAMGAAVPNCGVVTTLGRQLTPTLGCDINWWAVAGTTVAVWGIGGLAAWVILLLERMIDDE